MSSNEHLVHAKKPLADQLLIWSAFVLFLWSVLTSIINDRSYDAITSSTRIFIEISVYMFIARRFDLKGGLEGLIITLSVVNSVVVLFQILEQMDLVGTNFTSITEEFYGVEVEYFRKPGLLNGFQTSSLISFIAIVLSTARIKMKSLASARWYFVIVANIIPIFFGARVFLVLLPFLFVTNLRLILISLLLVLLTYIYSDFVGGELGEYIDERVVPAFTVVFGGGIASDYSAADTISHYRMPETIGELVIGNGAPRYPVGEGGGDPTLSRWYLQAGAPAGILITLISSFLIWRVARIGGAASKVLACALVLATLKGELVTASGVVFSLLALSTPPFFRRTKIRSTAPVILVPIRT